MTTRRSQILKALQGLVASDNFFPPAEIDEAQPDAWRESAEGLAAGLGDACAVQDGPLEVTRDGGGEDDFEVRLSAMIAYSVQSVDSLRDERRARRDEAEAKIEGLIAANRDLGLGPEVYAIIDQPVFRDEAAYGAGGNTVAVSQITISVDYTAASAAG